MSYSRWTSVVGAGGFVAAALVIVAMLAGCGVDPPDQRAKSCAVDSDCAEGRYCGEESICTSDCDPTADSPGCGGQQMCTERGECKRLDCTADSECPSAQFCEQGQCKQECQPGSAGGCAAGEKCSQRGECVVAGECLEDGDCEDVPSPYCEGNTLKSFSDEATCEQNGAKFECSYEAHEKTCGWGCSDGACLPDPCDGKSCDSPPAATCEGDTLVTYETPGTCQSDKAGKCDYEPKRVDCGIGCSMGKCETGPCTGMTCESPPADECDENTAVDYAETGTCRETMEGTKCDYAPSFENCSYTDATCMDATCKNPVGQKGGVVVTELMADPDGVSDPTGEWIEVYNAGSSAVDLNGWRLESKGMQSHAIAESVSVPSKGRAVLARSSDPVGDGSVTPDYTYGDDVLLSNGEDSVRLVDGDGNVVDFVYWEAGSVMAGHSRKLSPGVAPTVSNNDDFANWCPSLDTSETLGTGSDWGTPGSANKACASSPCSVITCERPEAFCQGGDATRPTKQEAECTKSRFNNPHCDYGVKTFNCTDEELCVTGKCESIPQNVPKSGELVITEMMGNPSAVSDADGEWIEVYNPTSGKLSLFTLTLRDNESGNASDEYTIVDKQATVPSKGYAVLAVEVDKAKNGGIQGAHHYKGSHLKNSPSGMKIELVRQDGTVVDSAHYGDPTSGASQQLDKQSYKGAASPAASNDTAQNWCEPTSTYGDGDKGTPGADNRDCP